MRSVIAVESNKLLVWFVEWLSGEGVLSGEFVVVVDPLVVNGTVMVAFGVEEDNVITSATSLIEVASDAEDDVNTGFKLVLLSE